MPIPVFENVRQEKLPKFQFQFLSLGKSGNQGCLTTMRGLDGKTGCEADSGSQRSLVGVEVEPGREERGGHVEDEDRDGSTNDAVIAPSIPWRHDEDNFVFARVSLVELFEAGVSPNLPLALRMRQGMPAQVEGRANLEDDAGFQIRRQEHVNPEDTDVVQHPQNLILPQQQQQQQPRGDLPQERQNLAPRHANTLSQILHSAIQVLEEEDDV